MDRKKNKINVLHIVLGLNTGGLERVVLDLVKFRTDQVNPFLCCLDEIGEQQQEISQLGIPYFELSNFGNKKVHTLFKLITYICENKIHIIHTHNPAPHFYGSISGFLTRRPVINTKHGRNYPNVLNRIWLNRLSSMMSKKIVCVSTDTRSVARDMEKVAEKKLITILNGVNIERYSVKNNDELQKVIGINNEKIVGIVARLSIEKDHETLLTAFSLVKKEIPNAYLLVIGDGPLKEKYISISEKLGINDTTLFLGNRRDIPELLSLMDVFVLSSLTEGISLTLIEAMSAKLPVVCTNTGGNPEVVVDGITGFIVDTRDHIAMADKIKILLLNPNLAKRMGIAGYDRASKEFSIHNTAKKYDNLYKEVLKR